MQTMRRLVLAAIILLPTAGAHAQVTLNFWDMIWGPPEYIEAAKALVAKFNQEHPGIEVKYRSVPWANWYQTYVTAIAAGTAPDLSTGAGYQAVQLYEMGAIRPLDDLIGELTASGALADFLPGTVERLRFDNHTVALPWGIDIRVWFYRKDLLADAKLTVPQSWADLRAAAKAETAEGRFGVVASGDTGGSHYLYSLILNNGGGLFDSNGALAFGTSANREALAFMSDLVKDGSVSPASAGYDSDARRRTFLQGQAGFVLDGPSFAESAPAGGRDQIGVLAPLAVPHGDKATIAWVNNIMVYQQTQHPAETKTFLTWWSKNELALWTEGHCRQLPARRSFAADAYFQNDPIRRFVIDTWLPISKSTGTFAPSTFPKLNAVEGDGVMQSLTQEILQGKDLAPAMAKADDKLKAILK